MCFINRFTDQRPFDAIPAFEPTIGQIQITDESHDHDPEQHRGRLWKALFFRSVGARPNHTTPHTNPFSNTFNNSYTAVGAGANGIARAQPRMAPAPPPLNTRIQQSARVGPNTGIRNGHANGIWHGNGSVNMHAPSYPAPATQTASRTANRPFPSAPSGQALSAKAPMTGVGTVVGTARTHGPGSLPPPSSRGSAGSASDKSSLGDSQRMSLTSPATAYTSGTGGDMRYMGGGGGHAPMLDGKGGGTGGGGGVRGFIARLTGGKADKSGKSKDF